MKKNPMKNAFHFVLKKSSIKQDSEVDNRKTRFFHEEL